MNGDYSQMGVEGLRSKVEKLEEDIQLIQKAIIMMRELHELYGQRIDNLEFKLGLRLRDDTFGRS
jgi:hypothetical protein